MKRKSNTPVAAPANAKQAKSSATPATPVTAEPKQSKLTVSDESIKDEERRRLVERSNRTIFMKNGGKLFKHYKEYKALHPDVVDVKASGSAAWLIFPTEGQCEKAFKELSTKKVKGKALDLDFCGAKSKNAEKIKSHRNAGERPMDKKKLLIKGFPSGTTAEKLKLIFPNAKEIYLPHSKKFNTRKQRFGFILFGNEADAFAHFKKAETLKIGGSPVDVLYAREADPAKTAPTPTPTTKANNTPKKANAKELTNGKPAKSAETPGKVVSGKGTPAKAVNGKPCSNAATPAKGKDTPKTKASNVHVDTPAPKGKTTPGKTQEAKNTLSKLGALATPAKKDLKTTPKLNGKSPAPPTSKGSLKPNGKVLAKEESSDDEDLDDEELDDEELGEDLEDEDSDIPSSNEGIEEASDDDDDDN